MKADKRYCFNCYDDYYNHGDNSTTGECWMFKTAKAVAKYKIAWWTPMDNKDNFQKVTTNSCHSEPGRYAFMDKLPSHLTG